MIDVILGSELGLFLILIDFVLMFFIGAIPGTYISFLLLNQFSKRYRSLWVIISLIIGSFCGYYSFSTIIGIFSSPNLLTHTWPWWIVMIVVGIEIFIVIMYRSRIRKHKVKK
ncbi:MAG: hypothetical protein AAB553_06765 [Patescibacteria group bacterium]